MLWMNLNGLAIGLFNVEVFPHVFRSLPFCVPSPSALSRFRPFDVNSEPLGLAISDPQGPSHLHLLASGPLATTVPSPFNFDPLSSVNSPSRGSSIPRLATFLPHISYFSTRSALRVHCQPSNLAPTGAGAWACLLRVAHCVNV